ncbi:MAG TPA: energy transducer TonB [Longimicrobium sp.]|nr:energy transducer TonB [Longimicrobium sp.]
MRNQALVLALLALSACAGTPSAGKLSPAASDGRSCRAERSPGELPAAAQLVDEAGLRADAARLWRTSGAPAGHVLFTLLYEADGVNVRRAVIEHTVPDAVADSLQKLVFAHALRAAGARDPWGVRLRIELGPEPALAVARREVCTAAPADRRSVASALPDVRDGEAGTAGLAASGMVWVRVSLDERGLVTGARVERGATRGLWEGRLLNYVRTLAFLPALEDGVAVAGETTIPVRLGS